MRRLVVSVSAVVAVLWIVPVSAGARSLNPTRPGDSLSSLRPQHRLFLPKHEMARREAGPATATTPLVASTPPPSAVSTVRIVNDPSNVYSETAVASNPFTAGQLLAGSNVTTATEMSAFNSTDAGAHWAANPVNPISPNIFASDPGIAFDSSHAFYSYIATDSSFNTTLYIAQNASSSASTQSWSSTGLTNPDPNAVNGELPDKPLIAVDNTTGKTNSHTNNVYIGYDTFPASSQVSNPIEVQVGQASTPFSEHQVWDSGGEFGADPAVDPTTGNLYIAWLDYCGLTPLTLNNPCPSNFTGQLLMATSTDGGLHWNAPVQIATLTTGAGSILPNYGGTCALGCAPRPIASFPSISFDSTGNLYAVWSDGADPQLGTSTVPSSHRMHIYFSKSTNGGSSWSSPSQLDTGNPNDAWEPAMSVDPNGTLTVAWYDRRDDTNNHLYRPYYTQSADHGTTWSTQIPLASDMSDPTTDCNGTGDYMSIAAAAGHAHAVWTDMSGSTPQIFTSDVTEAGSFTFSSSPTPSPLPDPNGTKWSQMPGSARDIGVGSDASCTPAVIGTDSLAGGGGVYVWAGAFSGWIGPVASGSGTRITVSAGGLPRITNNSNGIYRLLPNASGQFFWEQLQGSASDIASGADGSLWVIGTNPVPGGDGIWSYDFNSGNWSSPGGGGVRIAVGPDGQPWIVNSTGQIYCHSDSGWQLLPGSARDIGVGADGVAWVIGTNAVPGGYGIYRQSGGCSPGGGWIGVDGGALSISVGTDGLPFVVNNAGGIYERMF